MNKIKIETETTPGVAVDMRLISVDTTVYRIPWLSPIPESRTCTVELEAPDGATLRFTFPMPLEMTEPTPAWMLERIRYYVDRIYIWNKE